jgi:prophage protein
MADAYVAEVCENEGTERRCNMTTLTAEQRARNLLQNYPDMFPIDPFQIARDLGIEIRYLSNPGHNVSGTISRENANSPVIVGVNSNDAITRQRFTIAHELGHYTKLKEEGKIDSRLGFVEYRNELSSQGNDPVEIDANQFAAELLMPEHWIRHWNESGIGFKVIQKTLNVSEIALKNRFETLGLV